MLDQLTGYFLTWSAYNTWLPGDERGWILHRRGWKMPDPVRRLEAQAQMRESGCVLDPQQRQKVNTQIEVTCGIRGWRLHTLNRRTNPVHVVVWANGEKPRKVVRDL